MSTANDDCSMFNRIAGKNCPCPAVVLPLTGIISESVLRHQLWLSKHARSHHALAADSEANADAPAEPAPTKAAAANADTDIGARRVAWATVAVVRLLRGDTARDADH